MSDYELEDFFEEPRYQVNLDELINQKKYQPSSVNLAEDMDDVALVVLIALYSSVMFPLTISEEDVYKEITDLAESGNFDELAYKGLKWIQQIAQ